MVTDLYDTMEYSPGWYYWKWPGFYYEQCYVILLDCSHHPKKYLITTAKEEQVEGVEEFKDTNRVMEEVSDTTFSLVCLSVVLFIISTDEIRNQKQH